MKDSMHSHSLYFLYTILYSLVHCPIISRHFKKVIRLGLGLCLVLVKYSPNLFTCTNIAHTVLRVSSVLF